MLRHPLFMAALVCGFLLSASAFAQTAPTPVTIVVASCGSATYTAGQTRPITQDTTGRLCGSH